MKHTVLKPVLSIIVSLSFATSAFASNRSFNITENTPWGIIAIKAPQAWALSNQGEGTSVLVIDSGIDNEHPAIKGNLIESRNFSTDGSSPEDIGDTYLGHGTHVTGTIAALQAEDGFTGVAPKAKIYFAKAGNPNFSFSALASSIRWGIEKKVDVISMSFGQNNNQDEGLNNAIADATSAGIVVVAAVGNGADQGVTGINFPAINPNVIAVGSVTKRLKVSDSSQFGPELAVVAPGENIRSSVPRGSGFEINTKIIGDKLPETTVETTILTQLGLGDTFGETPMNYQSEIVNIEVGDENEFKSKNVTGKIILVPRDGGAKMSVKFKNASNHQVAAIIYYSETENPMTGAFILEDETVVPQVFSISLQDGLSLVSRIKSGEKISTQIRLNYSDYATYDGTSMAAPHVAGVALLMKAVNKKITPAQVKKILMSTAKSVTPVEKSGAGLIDAEKAVQAAGGVQ